MVELTQGDILHADVEALVNTVNCVGVMGRGIALQFRKAFPANAKAYEAACKRKEVRPGKMFVHDLGQLTNPRYIVNFPTKRHWKGQSRLEDIEAGLKALVEEIRALNIRSIAIPPLGCGLGGLDWNDVRPRIEAALRELPDIRALIFEPTGAPKAEEMSKVKKAPRMTIGRAALIGLIRRYLAAVMDPAVSLLEIHKLMYFLQEAGEGLRLEYKKALYGPYAENLRHVLSAIEGHFITGYGDAEDRPDKEIEVCPPVWNLAEEFLRNHPATSLHFGRVAELIDGFETPFGLELLATVHWVATREGASTPEEAIARTYAWNDRKRAFTERHIRMAWNVLHDKGWLK
ncbi:MAG: macro domain-containing protein [Candidatus Lambdaproteobacteria bacterium]|nr:macro domain-containing protein [Candidatus Lambdaproteobacteria bacterium]